MLCLSQLAGRLESIGSEPFGDLVWISGLVWTMYIWISGLVSGVKYVIYLSPVPIFPIY